jgi:hypothetical protein
VPATFYTRDQVVDIDECGVAAAGHLAPPAVASKHGASKCRRNALGRTRRARLLDFSVARGTRHFGCRVGGQPCLFPHAGARQHVSDALPIASRHLDDFGRDVNEIAPALLPPPPATFTDS